MIKWFSLWGYNLDVYDINAPFSKTIIQTNWSNSCNPSIPDIYGLCLSEEAINNFIYHIKTFEPRIILFMGSERNNILRNELVFKRLTEIIGSEIKEKSILQKGFDGIKYKIGFNYFEKCTIIRFPHPSNRNGVSYDYISLFKKEMHSILESFKREKALK